MIFKKEPWWKFPFIFEWNFEVPCPYIWFGWWLITWNSDNNLFDISISFQPD